MGSRARRVRARRRRDVDQSGTFYPPAWKTADCRPTPEARSASAKRTTSNGSMVPRRPARPGQRAEAVGPSGTTPVLKHPSLAHRPRVKVIPRSPRPPEAASRSGWKGGPLVRYVRPAKNDRGILAGHPQVVATGFRPPSLATVWGYSRYGDVARRSYRVAIIG